MRVDARSLLPASLLTCLVLFSPMDARAAWLQDGNPVCTASGDQTTIVAAPDGAGGVYLVWRDARRGAGLADLYGSRVLADGTVAPGWPVDGRALAQTGLAGTPYVMGDGAGGLLVLWFDTSTYQARLQRVGADGSLASGFPADGKVLPIGVGGPGGYHVRACEDGTGGVYVTWNSFNGTVEIIYLTRFTASGALAAGWTAGGVAVGGGGLTLQPVYVQLTLGSDPAGGALSGQITVREDQPSGSSKLGLHRRTLANAAAGWSTGLSPTGHDGQQGSHHYVESMSHVPDAAGGAFTAWRIGGPLGPALYIQRYSSTGALSWPDPTAAPVMDAMFRDDTGGVHLLGRPLGLDQLELHRRAGDASVPAGWAGGHLLSNSGSYSAFAGVRSGPRTVVGWSSGAPGDHDILASAVDDAGTLVSGWTPGGTPVCEAAGQQELAALVPGSADDAFVAWSDRRSGASDVYVARLLVGGPAWLDVPGAGPRAAVRLAAERVTPNPARERAAFSLVLPRSEPAVVEIVDLAGRVLARAEARPIAGRQWVELEISRLASGVYFARVRQGDASAAVRFGAIR